MQPIYNWTVEQMESWGKLVGGKCVPYPTEIFLECLELCSRGVPAAQVRFVLKSTIRTWCPELGNVNWTAPSAKTVGEWMPALLVLSDLVSAWKIAKSKTLTLGTDGTTKKQKKQGVAVIQTDLGPVMGNGVYTQVDGTSLHTAQCAFEAGFEMPLATLKSLRDYVEQGAKAIGGRRSERRGASAESCDVRTP